jgi:tRNA-2-methylthio-N6-dimethylallyladenosine synthase
MEGQVPAQVQDDRLQRLQALLNAQQLAFNQATVGKRTTILVERDGKRPGQRVGKSPWLQSVHMEASAPIGSLIEVDIVDAAPHSLAGALALRDAA